MGGFTLHACNNPACEPCRAEALTRLMAEGYQEEAATPEVIVVARALAKAESAEYADWVSYLPDARAAIDALDAFRGAS